MDHLLKIKKELKNLKKQGIQVKFIKLDKACFQHDMAYGDIKDLKRTTATDKILKNKVLNIAKSPKYDGYQRGLASMVYKFFDKKSAGGGIVNNNNNNNNNNRKQNQHPLDLAALQVAEELHKPIIGKLKKEKFILDLQIIFRVLI